uniref:Conjugal transfer relaxase TraI n=1 Tax=Polaromonas sp. W10N TaxID=1840301 RepID=A0A2S1FIJ9_9BURK|nr:conjugal transfer relaxase TraI [Polaromonas sp. W10N]
MANGHEKCIHHEAENFITDDLQSQTLEMVALAHEAVRSKDPIDHYVLSWQEGEQPTIKQAREAVQMAMKHLGLEGHQVIWAMHADTDNVHIHIEVNRVHPETFKVVEINKGFQRNAIQQAAAIVEKVQGWKTHDKARFKTDELGHLITDSKTKLPQVFTAADKQKEPTGQVKDKEIQTGEKSAQRIGIEQAAPIIAAATSWKQLHAELEKVGIEYRRDGSGAKLFINNTAVKASDVVDRKNNFGALQKRIGLYQSSNQPEIKNDPFNRTQLITDTRFKTGFDEPNIVATGFSTFNTLHDLPSGNLDVTNTTNWQKSKTQNLLQSHESSDNRGTGRVRRGSHSSGTERSAASQSRQPLKDNQPGWNQYQQIKEANDSERSAESLALSKRHDSEKADLKAAQKEEREAELKRVPKGNGAMLNITRSAISVKQKPATQEQKERHSAELKAFQASLKSIPVYKNWQAEPQIVSERVRSLIDQHITRDTQPPRVSQIIKQLTQRRDEHRHFTYSLDKNDVFRDEGKIIKILDLKSDSGIAAALATAQQKYGDVLTLTGSDAFKQNAVAVAVEHNLTCRYDDPQLEKLRTQFQAQKDAAVLEAARAERDRAAAAQLEKSKEPAPLHSPIQQTGAAVPLGSGPQILDSGFTLNRPPPREAKQPIELDMKGLVTDRERELVQRIDAAIKVNDGAELEACMNTFGSIRNEAARALGAVAPQEINRAAIEHQVKTEQNTTALKRGHPEPWYLSGIGSITRVCAWDAIAIKKAAERDAHAKTPQPEGMFKGAERKAWDQHNADLSGKAEDWLTAAKGLKRELALTTEQRMPNEAATVAAQNAKNAPEHATQLERFEALTVVEKRLEAALRPHKEKKQRELGKSQGC